MDQHRPDDDCAFDCALQAGRDFRMLSMLLTIPRITAPIRVPNMLPLLPESEVPPMLATAMASYPHITGQASITSRITGHKWPPPP